MQSIIITTLAFLADTDSAEIDRLNRIEDALDAAEERMALIEGALYDGRVEDARCLRACGDDLLDWLYGDIDDGCASAFVRLFAIDERLS